MCHSGCYCPLKWPTIMRSVTLLHESCPAFHTSLWWPISGQWGVQCSKFKTFSNYIAFYSSKFVFRTTKLFLDLIYSTQTTAMYQQYMIIPGPHPFLPHLTWNIKRKTTYIFSLFLNSSNVIPFSILFRAIKIWPLCFTWQYLHTGCLSAYDCLNLLGLH